MSAVAFFNSARAYKRELTGEPGAKLSQEDVDVLNKATVDRWKPAGREKLHLRSATALKAPGAFYGALRGSLGRLSQDQVDGINALLAATSAAGWPISWVAYALATAWHETAHTMQPIKELGGSTYFHRMYDIQGERPKKAKELGNLAPGDGARFAGRGYVQLTGRINYVNAGLALGIDLPENPDLAMQPDVAAKILIWGMAGGKFTTKALKDYLPANRAASVGEFTAARRIINGQDRARSIADLALKFQTALALGEWG